MIDCHRPANRVKPEKGKAKPKFMISPSCVSVGLIDPMQGSVERIICIRNTRMIGLPLLALVELEDDPELDEDVDIFADALEDDRLSLIHGGSPLLEKSFSRRNDIVNRMMDALSSCDVMAGGRGNILANS